ncbi:hypothetical protein E0K83_08750 [Gramella sp. BOM4]|nr:hypothetical protein [Christiangramia bathymodioli]
MRFQHPELLYALLLLLLPIIVHLFRLRKFQKEDFTNVKFLKKVIQETRKSSRLKKFLILFTRLFLVACLVLAFAQPYIPAGEKAIKQVKTFIYLDNSFSMEAGNGPNSLLQLAVTDLLNGLQENSDYALVTNNSEFYGRSTADIKDELQELQPTSEDIDFRQIQLKAENYFKDTPELSKEVLIISDFQNSLNLPQQLQTGSIEYKFIPTRIENIRNISLDTALISDSNPESIELSLRIKANYKSQEPVAISVRHGERLLGRNTVEIDAGEEKEIQFQLKNEQISNGQIEIEDPGWPYDNRLFFSISENPPARVVVISNADVAFLEKIYSEPEFETSIFTPNQIDFNQLNSANLIVLNELRAVSSSLATNLGSSMSSGTSVIVIPAAEISNYNRLLSSLELPEFMGSAENERLISSIEFDHPLLDGVFEDRTQNFEYPKVTSSYILPLRGSILLYEDNSPFLIANNAAYLFSAALNSDNSNFQNSPLIVPIFYQIGLESLKKPQLYYLTGSDSKIDIQASLGKDEVLKLSNSEASVIPQQQNFNNRVQLSTTGLDLAAGNYTVEAGQEELGMISLNYDRKESELQFVNVEDIEGVEVIDSVKEYFTQANAASQINALWKWFVIFALFFLAAEMLLIKFFK